MIYLDSAATSFLKPASVYAAVQKAMREAASPGRGTHAAAARAAELVYACREEAASLFRMSDPSRVVFTFNATHALNIAIRTLASKGARVLISGYEHNAVTRPLRAVGADVSVFGRGLFDPAGLLRELSAQIDGAELAVCTQVSNVFGYVLPLPEIAALCREHGVPLIVDASQGAGIMDLDMQALGAAFAAMPGHKGLFGPQGTGLLLCGRSAEPLLYGGTGGESLNPDMPAELPERLEAGTMNVAGIAGLLAGLRYVRSRGPEAIRRREERLLRRTAERLSGAKGLRLYIDPAGEQAGILSLSVEGLDSETACERLGEAGIMARGGLHCAPLAHESSGTLREGTVRLSFSPFLGEAQAILAAERIRKLF